MNCPSCQAENEPSASVCARCGASLAAPTQVVITIDLTPGAMFHGRYQVLGPLGRGGMGMVYKAHDKTLDEVVAIKVLRPDFAQDPKMAERFKSEIKLARKVRHKNVCTIHDYGDDRGLLFISMEFIEGIDLKRLLKEKGGLPPSEAYDLAIQVAEGLQAVHEAGIIHRDLKTPNIIRDGQGVARLMDFGIAKRQGSEGTMTATGQVVGTPEYMSPEQAQGHKVDYRSDIYALGIVTYEIFTGQVPFRGETPISTILKHLHDPPPLDGPAAARIPADLKPVLRKALAKEPADRFATALDFAEALRQARSPSRRAQPIATAVLEAPTVRRGRPGSGRRPLLAWLLVFPLVAVAAGVFVLQRKSVPLRPATGAAPSVEASATPAALATTAAPTAALTPSSMAPPAATPAVATPRPLPAPAVRTPPPAAAPPTKPPVVAIATPTPAPSSTPPPPTPAPATPREPPAPLGAGLLQVAVRPWGEVSVDGAVIGTTPLDKIPLSAGAHSVRVRHPAYEPVERRITVRPGQLEHFVVDFPTEGVRKP